MSNENTEVCSICGRPTLPITASKTGGICRGCETINSAVANRALWEEKCRIFGTPLRRPEFAALAMDVDQERACHAVFERAHWTWTVHGLEQLTLGERTVIAVETFFGECCNGGFFQYLTNESGALAIDLPAALVRARLPAYASVAFDLLRLFPTAFPRDSDERWASLKALEASFDSSPLEWANKQFFELYQRDGHDYFRRHLHEYIFSHPSEFVSSHT